MDSKLIRLYADEKGESHFEDVIIDLHETEFVPPTPPPLLSSSLPDESYSFQLVPPGWTWDWHTAPTRALAIYLAG